MVEIAGTIRASEGEGQEILLCYTPMPKLLDEREQLLSAKQEMTDNFEWMMAANTGNVYISDMDTYELLYVNKKSCCNGNCRSQAYGKNNLQCFPAQSDFFVHNPCSSASSVFKAYDFFPAFYSLQDRISSFYYSITDTTCL